MESILSFSQFYLILIIFGIRIDQIVVVELWLLNIPKQTSDTDAIYNYWTTIEFTVLTYVIEID